MALLNMLTHCQTSVNGCFYGLSISGSVESDCALWQTPFDADPWTMQMSAQSN